MPKTKRRNSTRSADKVSLRLFFFTQMSTQCCGLWLLLTKSVTPTTKLRTPTGELLHKSPPGIWAVGGNPAAACAPLPATALLSSTACAGALTHACVLLLSNLADRLFRPALYLIRSLRPLLLRRIACRRTNGRLQARLHRFWRFMRTLRYWQRPPMSRRATKGSTLLNYKIHAIRLDCKQNQGETSLNWCGQPSHPFTPNMWRNPK
jgi:hypothetical protein